jgi:hypothetical protein
MEDDVAYSPPGSALPNVAHFREHGITSLGVHCAADLVCSHSRVMTFDELRLADDAVLINVPRVRRFVCTRCGRREVQVRPEWPPNNASEPFCSPAMR